MKTTRQRGPLVTNSCENCIAIHSHKGAHESHHTCLQDAWPSVVQTPHGEYPKTPSTCPYLNK